MMMVSFKSRPTWDRSYGTISIDFTLTARVMNSRPLRSCPDDYSNSPETSDDAPRYVYLIGLKEDRRTK